MGVRLTPGGKTGGECGRTLRIVQVGMGDIRGRINPANQRHDQRAEQCRCRLRREVLRRCRRIMTVLDRLVRLIEVNFAIVMVMVVHMLGVRHLMNRAKPCQASASDLRSKALQRQANEQQQAEESAHELNPWKLTRL